MPAARLGLGYGFIDVKRLVDIVGPAYAREILYTGRRFTAAEALQMGLLHRVVAADELPGAVGALAETLAANAPLTIRAMKRCIAEATKDRAERNTEGLPRTGRGLLRQRRLRRRPPRLHGQEEAGVSGAVSSMLTAAVGFLASLPSPSSWPTIVGEPRKEKPRRSGGSGRARGGAGLLNR